MLPYRVRRSSSNSAPAVSAKNEELGQIPNGPIARGTWLLLHEDQSGKFSIGPEEERVPVRFRPIERKVTVTESAVQADVRFEELAEIVNIQLQQVRQDRLIFVLGGDQFYLREELF